METSLIAWVVQPSIIATLVFVAYASLCRKLRYSRMHKQHSKFPYKTRDDFRKMTNEHAWQIQRCLMEYEFPFIFQKSLEMALFRTYGIPTISKLLVKTGQLATGKNAARRYVDTEVLILEFMTQHPEGERANQAIARMNVLHAGYQRAGLISNDDMLYTLSLFAVEPVRWIKEVEWRELSEMEICALGTFWKSHGDAMKIDYSALPSYKTGWQDGLHWWNEMRAWSLKYEEQYMVPHSDNAQTADETLAILLYDVPTFVVPFARQFVYALMEPRLLRAFMYPDPPAWVQRFVNSGMAIRKATLRHLTLPRWTPRRVLSDKPDKNGRLHLQEYQGEPWYVPNSLMFRWGPMAWYKWACGNPIPGHGYKPEGYVISEVGPRGLENKYMKDFEEGHARLRAGRRGGCPFAVA